MKTLHKITNIALIFMVIVLLWSNFGYSLHQETFLRPFLSFSEKNKNTYKGEEYKKALLQQHKKDIEYLRKIQEVAEKGGDVLGALRPSTRRLLKRLIQNPEDELKDIDFDPMLFYELYTIFKPYKLTKAAERFLKEHPQLFNQDSTDITKMVWFHETIIQKLVLNKLNLRKDEMSILMEYMNVGYSPHKEWKRKIQKTVEIVFQHDRKSNPHTKIIYKYCSILYSLRAEAVKWIWEKSLITDDIRDFGAGDEHGFDANLGIGPLGSYMEDYNLMDFEQWANIGRVKSYVITAKVSKAILLLKRILLNDFDSLDKDIERKYAKGNLHPHAISLVRKELLWMYENGLYEVNEIAEALDMDRISAREIVLLLGRLPMFSKDEIKSEIRRRVSLDDGLILEHIVSKEISQAMMYLDTDAFLEGREGINELLQKLERGKDYMEEHMISISAFISEKAMLAWAKFAKTHKHDQKRCALGVDIIENKDNCRDIIIDIMSDYHAYLKRVLKELDEIITYFRERNKSLTQERLTEELTSGRSTDL
jgi:hypothetical protein